MRHVAEPVIDVASRIPAMVAAPAVGPVVVIVLGYNVPVMSACLSLLGVVLASMIAPPPPRPLSLVQRIALIVLLSFLAVALAINGTVSPVVSLCWSIGIGYSGLPLIAEIQRIIFNRAAQMIGEGSILPPATPPAPPAPQTIVSTASQAPLIAEPEPQS